MKRIHTTLIVLALSISTKAQNSDPTREIEIKRASFHLFETLLPLALFAVAILYLIKMILDHRIKNRLVENGASDAVVRQLLQPGVKDERNIVIKWVCVLSSSGIGLLLVNQFQPLGIHSLAIISLCLAGGFLAYYFIIRETPSK